MIHRLNRPTATRITHMDPCSLPRCLRHLTFIIFVFFKRLFFVGVSYIFWPVANVVFLTYQQLILFWWIYNERCLLIFKFWKWEIHCWFIMDMRDRSQIILVSHKVLLFRFNILVFRFRWRTNYAFIFALFKLICLVLYVLFQDYKLRVSLLDLFFHLLDYFFSDL